VIPRYSLPEIADLFTDEARFGAWLEVEVLAVEAWAQLGVVPADAARVVRERARVDVAAVNEREKVTDHDVAAFVDVVQASVGLPEGAWVHYGLTSSDVVDTALALQMTRALDRIEPAAAALESAIAARAREFRDTPMVGRTHGIHAEPTTFGMKLALWAMQVRRDRERLLRARDAIAVGKLSGAVGTFSNVDPVVERYVCEHLGLTPVPATQVLARDRHAEVLYACASVGATVESFATEIRHLQRTELREAEEAFREGEQKGSSAMPHKRNPVKSEQLSGLARVLRGNLQAALEDVALWHERDISHSSVERIIVPDSLMLAYYVLVQFTKIVTGLRVYPERMLRNLDASFGLVFSQPVLLALVEAGASRDDAYRIVQRNAMRAWQEECSFRDLLGEDPDVRAVLDEARLDACFDLKRALANVGRTFDELDHLEATPLSRRDE
jgi:adenylosuccinate lyase